MYLCAPCVALLDGAVHIVRAVLVAHGRPARAAHDVKAAAFQHGLQNVQKLVVFESFVTLLAIGALIAALVGLVVRRGQIDLRLLRRRVLVALLIIRVAEGVRGLHAGVLLLVHAAAVAYHAALRAGVALDGAEALAHDLRHDARVVIAEENLCAHLRRSAQLPRSLEVPLQVVHARAQTVVRQVLQPLRLCYAERLHVHPRHERGAPRVPLLFPVIKMGDGVNVPCVLCEVLVPCVGGLAVEIVCLRRVVGSFLKIAQLLPGYLDDLTGAAHTASSTLSFSCFVI